MATLHRHFFPCWNMGNALWHVISTARSSATVSQKIHLWAKLGVSNLFEDLWWNWNYLCQVPIRVINWTQSIEGLWQTASQCFCIYNYSPLDFNFHWIMLCLVLWACDLPMEMTSWLGMHSFACQRNSLGFETQRISMPGVLVNPKRECFEIFNTCT